MFIILFRQHGNALMTKHSLNVIVVIVTIIAVAAVVVFVEHTQTQPVDAFRCRLNLIAGTRIYLKPTIMMIMLAIFIIIVIIMTLLLILNKSEEYFFFFCLFL